MRSDDATLELMTMGMNTNLGAPRVLSTMSSNLLNKKRRTKSVLALNKLNLPRWRPWCTPDKDGAGGSRQGMPQLSRLGRIWNKQAFLAQVGLSLL